MLRSFILTFLLSPLALFAQEHFTQFTGQNAIHANPARIGMNSNLRVSSSDQIPNEAWATGIEYFNEKWKMGIGAGVYHHDNIWASANRFSLALNRK